MFKKLIVLLFVLLPLVAFGATEGYAPTYQSVDGVYQLALDTMIASAGPFDTLTSATDSVDLYTGWEPDDGWEYILSKAAITGTGSDSVKIAVNLDVYDYEGNLHMRYAQDSISDAASELIVLPVRSIIPGAKFDIVLKCYTAAGSQVIINQMAIWKRRPMNITKRGF